MKTLLFLLLSTAHAQQVITVPGPRVVSFGSIMVAVVNFLAGSALAVCGALFFVGAVWMVAGAGKEDQRSKGKDIMIDSLKGLAIILGSYGILRSVLFLVTG